MERYFKEGWLIRSTVVLLLCAGLISVCNAGYEATYKVRGFLIIAHGFTKDWNDKVCTALSEVTLDEDKLCEVCFLEDFTGDGVGYIPPREAYDMLIRRGATEVVGIPLFVDGNSNHITEVRYVLGLEEMDDPEDALIAARIAQGDVPIVGLTPAIDGHPLVAEAFARMILDADDTAKENRVIVVAHGPNSNEEEAKWIANMGSLYYVLESELPAGFIVEYHLMTLRVMDFPYFAERLKELHGKIKEFAGKGEVFLLYFHISPGYLDMIIQGVRPGSLAHIMFPGCLDKLMPDELANVIHLSPGFCEMGILPAIVQARAEEWLVCEEAGVYCGDA